MPKLRQFIASTAACLLALSIGGCTLFPEQKNPTLKNTTSAEQYERILWQTVEKQQWNKISPLFSTTLIWNANGKSLSADQVLPYLQTLHLKDAAVTGVTVQPNGPDMTVAYTLQYTDDRSGGGCVANYSALSVWQQMKGGSYILIAHSDVRTGGTCTAS
jgi:hypothetical protein